MMVNVLNPSLALLTDLYELTMAYGYWKSNLAEREAVFHLAFRQAPFGGQYAIAAGLAPAIDYLKKLQFGDGDLAYLAKLPGADGKPLFDRAFLVYLRRMRFTLDVDAVPEGTAVFANEPLVRVKGPLLQCQIVESALLNVINFQTLIATKAARICQAAHGEPVLEFGLRRAQGIDGAISASRAAYIGGCAGTSNVLAGKIYGIPVKGTHAHSWVMSFDSELASFEAYANAMPNNCVFLVDTYDTLDGVRNAIEIGKRLRERGQELLGVRLDSGDFAYLSIEARQMLDEAGFAKAKILASNDLDEHLIADLKHQGATIGVWGVGTRLVTGFDQSALGGVYKLSALRDESGHWQHKLKLSEQSAKTSVPGILQVRRFKKDDRLVADAIYDTITGIGDAGCTVVDPVDMIRRKSIDAGTEFEDLLVPIFREGRPAYDQPALADLRQRAIAQLNCLHASVRRLKNPHRYPAGLELKLFDLRTQLALEAKGFAETPKPAPPQREEATSNAQSEAEAALPTTPALVTAPDEAKKPPAPQRPKFAGIGARFGQPPANPNIRVKVNPALRTNPLGPRGPKPS